MGSSMFGMIPFFDALKIRDRESLESFLAAFSLRAIRPADSPNS